MLNQNLLAIGCQQGPQQVVNRSAPNLSTVTVFGHWLSAYFDPQRPESGARATPGDHQQRRRPQATGAAAGRQKRTRSGHRRGDAVRHFRVVYSHIAIIHVASNSSEF